MPRSAPEYLRHILDEANFLLAQSANVEKTKFLQDPVLKRAFVRSLEVIGEAAKQISAEKRNQYGHLDWKGMAGMRDRLIHSYFGVDYEIVWDVVTKEIPALREAIALILLSDD